MQRECSAHAQAKRVRRDNDKDQDIGQNPLRHHGIIMALGRVHGLLPPGGTQAPFAAGLEADGSQIVATRGGEVEEFLGENAWLKEIVNNGTAC